MTEDYSSENYRAAIRSISDGYRTLWRRVREAAALRVQSHMMRGEVEEKALRDLDKAALKAIKAVDWVHTSAFEIVDGSED